MTEAMRTLKEIRQEMQAKDAGILQLTEELSIAQSERQRISDKRRQKISDKNSVVESLEHTNQRRARMIHKRDAARATVQEHITMATLVSTRVQIDPGETPDSLDRKLERLQGDIARYNQRCVEKKIGHSNTS